MPNDLMALADAYQQQLAHWRATLDSGAHRIGWKIGLNAPPVMEKLGLEDPVVGHLTSATLIGADGSHSLAGADAPKVEPELAIEVGPGNTVAGLAAAIEVVDLPGPPSPGELDDVVGSNIFHRAVAIGPSRDVRDADGIEAVFTVSGEQVGTADVGTVDIAGTIATAARVLEAAGESLQAGDRIIAGTLMPPPPVSGGDLVTLDLGDLGSVRIAFSG